MPLWQVHEDVQLKAMMLEGSTDVEIANWLGRSPSSINSRLRVLGLRRKAYRKRVAPYKKRYILTTMLHRDDKGFAEDEQGKWWQTQIAADRHFAARLKRRAGKG
jgi:hypothetical protein